MIRYAEECFIVNTNPSLLPYCIRMSVAHDYISENKEKNLKEYSIPNMIFHQQLMMKWGLCMLALIVSLRLVL